MREWWSKLRRALSGRRGLADDLAEEIESNLDLAADDNLARGMQPDSARTAARRRFGNTTLIKERAQEAWSFPRFETLLQDVRYGLRSIRKSPGFALVIILTLALGIGANTAIFSVVDAVLLKPLPFPDAERLVMLGESTPKAENISITWRNYLYWRTLNHSFDDMGGREMTHFTLTGRAEPLSTTAGLVTHDFLHLVGARPVLGRVFTEEEDRAGAARTVVLDHSFWLEKLGGDANVLGTTLTLNGALYEVIGVLQPGLQLTPALRHVDYYLPLGTFRKDTMPRAGHGSMRVLARLRPGVTLAAARADLDGIMQRLAQEDPGPETGHHAYAGFLSASATGTIGPTLWMLMGAVVLILLIACANVANLVLARSATRAREIAIRTAIGAGRKRLVRQVLTENLLVAGIGGAFGLLLANGCLRALLAIAPSGIPRLQEATLDLKVLLFTAALTIVTGLLVGFVPVLTAGKVDLLSALSSGGRSGTGTKRERGFRNVLVVAEIAITLVLAFGSGILLRSLSKAQNSNPGFIPERLLSLELVLPSSSYKSHQSILNFYDALTQNLRSLPGAAAVSVVNCPPSVGTCSDYWYSILGGPVPARGDVPLSVLNIADPAYFQTIGIPLREGRGFTVSDREGAPLVVVVNETLARRWWPKVSAVGHIIKLGGPYVEGPTYEIVGVVGDVSQEGLDATPMPEIYRPMAQDANEAMTVLVRTGGDPNSLAPAVRRSVASLDHNLPIQRLRSFENVVAATLNSRRFSTLLLAIFAGLALTLSAVGVYGLLNYWVTAREEEIAIRLALGARRSNILRWSGLAAAKLVVAGIVLGVAGGWAASHWLETLVFGISPRDTTMMMTAVLVVMAIAVLAAAIPLGRATQVDAARKLQRA
jgi:putative ABC transport system permease protein